MAPLTRPASSSDEYDEAVTEGRASRAFRRHGARPRHHRRRRHLQPADGACRLRADLDRLDGPHDGRRPRAWDGLRGAGTPHACGGGSLRVCASRLRQPARLRERLVVLDHRVGGQCRHRGRRGPLCRGLRQHGPREAVVDPPYPHRPLGCRVHQPQRGQEHGRLPDLDHGSEVRRAGVRVGRGAVLHRQRQLRPVERERRERDRRDRRRHGHRLVQLPGHRDGVRRGGEGPRPRSQRPPRDHARDPCERGRLHAVADRRLRDPAGGRAG